MGGRSNQFHDASPVERRRVVKAHRASHADPIALSAGDLLTVGRRDTTWPDYLWCTGPDGREGWVPEVFLEAATPGTSPRRAGRDYDARELDVAPGDVILAGEEAGGWYWCEALDGRRGWVPAECLAGVEAKGGAVTDDLTKWCERAVELGADKATAIGTGQIVAAEWVRMKCLYGCDEPGVYKTCPPDGAPSVEQTKRVLGEFQRAVLLGVGPVVGYDKSDAESRRLNDAAKALERELFLAGFHKAWTMGAGPCDVCSACAEGKDCPTPDKARPAMEACGIDVFTTVRNADWEIDVVRTPESEYRYFALVLVD